MSLNISMVLIFGIYAGENPGFLERGFIYIKVWGFALMFLSYFLKYAMKMK